MSRYALMERRIAELEAMQKEYNAFMNYVVEYHNNGFLDGEKGFMIDSDKMKKLVCLPIRSEISKDGKQMVLTRVQPTNGSRIIKPT